MAINRFMQPWKRDFSSEQYVPNFDAWAQALQKKDVAIDKGFEEIDALEKLVPQAGLATQEARKTWMAQVRKQSAALAENLTRTGDIASTRRATKKMASDILANPWTPVFEQDKALMEFAMKTRSTPGYERSVNYHTDANGNVIQLKDPTQWKDDYYRTIMPADAIPEYQKKIAMIKPIIEKWTEDGSQLIVQEDPETGFKGIFRKRVDGTIEKVTLEQVKDVLTKDYNGMDFLDLGLANPEGPGRLYDEGMFEKQFGRKFSKDDYLTRLIIAGMPLYYEKSDISTTFNKVATLNDSSTKKDGATNIPDVALASNTRSLNMRLDNVPESAIDVYNTYAGYQRTLNNIDKTHAAEMNKRYAEALKIKGDEEIFVKNSEGFYEINSKLPWTTQLPVNPDNPDAQAATLNDRLEGYRNEAANDATYKEELDALNARIAQVQSGKVAAEVILGDAGISQADLADYDKVRAQILAEVEAQSNRGSEEQTSGLSSTGQVAVARMTPEEIDAEVNYRLAKKFKDKPSFTKVQGILDELQDKPIKTVEARYWSLAGLTTKGQSFTNSLNIMTYDLLFNAINNNTVKLHQDDKILDGKDARRLEIKNFLNEYLSEDESDTGKSKYKFVTAADVKIIEDREDGFIAVYRIKGKNGRMEEYEVKIPTEFMINYQGADGTTKSENLAQAMGITSNAQVFNRTQQIAEAWQTNNGYYIHKSVIDGVKDGKTTMVSHLDVYRQGAKGDKVTTTITHDKKVYNINMVGGARQVAMLEMAIGDMKNMANTAENKAGMVKHLQQQLGISENQSQVLAETFLGAEYGIDKVAYLNSDVGYNTRGRKIEVSIDMKQDLDDFHKTVGHDNFTLEGGYRSPKKNAETKGSVKDSKHMSGNAVDYQYTDEAKLAIEKKYGVTLKDNVAVVLPGTNLEVMIHVDVAGGVPKHIHIERAKI